MSYDESWSSISLVSIVPTKRKKLEINCLTSFSTTYCICLDLTSLILSFLPFCGVSLSSNDPTGVIATNYTDSVMITVKSSNVFLASDSPCHATISSYQ